MLGTNDLKHRFAVLPVDVAAAAAGLGRLVERYDYGAGYPVPRVLLVSPIEIGDGISRSRFTGFTEQAAAYSRELAPLVEARARANGWLYLNAASVAKPSPNDHLHMEAADHRALAKALAQIVRGAFEEEGKSSQKRRASGGLRAGALLRMITLTLKVPLQSFSLGLKAMGLASLGR